MITNRSIAAGLRFRLPPKFPTRWRPIEPATSGPGERTLHPVLAELVGARLFEPLAQSIRVLIGAFGAEAAALFQNLFLDEDLRAGAQGQRDRIARPAVDRERGIAAG